MRRFVIVLSTLLVMATALSGPVSACGGHLQSKR